MSKAKTRTVFIMVLALVMIMTSMSEVFAKSLLGDDYPEHNVTKKESHLKNVCQAPTETEVTARVDGWKDATCSGASYMQPDGSEDEFPVLYREFTQLDETGGLEVLYKNFIKLGGEKYDVKLTLGEINFHTFNSLYVIVNKRYPVVSINQAEYVSDGTIVPSTYVDAGTAELEVTVDIYKAGTTEKAKLPLITTLKNMEAPTGETELNRGNIWTFEGITPSESNLFTDEDADTLWYKTNDGVTTVWGKVASGKQYDDNLYIDLPAVKNSGTTAIYLGHVAENSSQKKGSGTAFMFSAEERLIEYVSDEHGTIDGEASERIVDLSNPEGRETTPEDLYEFSHWTCNKDVTLEDGTEISSGSELTPEQVETVVVKENLTFTAHHTKIPEYSVTYEWEGEHPDEDVPVGETSILRGSDYDVDTTYEKDMEVEGEKDGKNGFWTFGGWDKTGTIEINENTVIKGEWSFTPYVSVTYEWDGEHPDVELPEGEADMEPGSTHTVDTSYEEGDEVEGTKDEKNGIWEFEGWDKSGEITVEEDTVIKGAWTFTPYVSVFYEWEGEHPETELPEGKSDIKKGSDYTVDTTYNKDTEITGEKDEKKGTWVFLGWDKEETIKVEEDTVVKGEWDFIPFVSVSYKWEGDHPDETLPEGEKDLKPGTEHTVDTTFTEDTEVKGSKDGKNGTWKFNGWDKSGTIEIDEDTIITGTWDFIPNVNVTYEWEGEHPDEELPEGELDIEPGTQHEVDTTYEKGLEVDGYKDEKHGTWVFLGWDKEGAITVEEDTVIKGSWDFVPNVDVSYEWDGEHPNTEVPEGVNDIKPGTPYEVDTTFAEGDEIEEPKDGKEGMWFFLGWDKEGTITIDDNTVIKGKWNFIPYVNVSYAWDGVHPDETLPEGKEKILKGNTYEVDTTYTDDTEVVGTKGGSKGVWFFQGWNKTGTITVEEDTVIKGAWSFVPYMTVTYAWDGEHPERAVPSGDTEVLQGSAYMVDNTYNEETRVPGEKDGKSGIWKFLGWNRTGLITIYENTVLTGKWIFTDNVSVTYKWLGEHPAVEPPASEMDIVPGSTYTVDTTFVKNSTKVKESKDEQRGYYLFKGWDKTGDITVLENTEINGIWEFRPLYEIKTSAENGDITDNIEDIENGETKQVSYTPNAGYQLKTLTVDDEQKSITQNAESYTFRNINEDHDIKVVFERTPEVKITKTASEDVVQGGDAVTYTVKIEQTNAGAEARNVTIKDVLPNGFSLENIEFPEEASEKTSGETSYSFVIPSLKDNMTFKYTVKTSKSTGDHENTVTAQADNVDGVARATARVRTVMPSVKLTKKVSNEKPEYGDEITYTITLTQTEEGAELRNAVITEEVPKEVEILSISAEEPATCVLEGNKVTATQSKVTDKMVVTIRGRVNTMEGKVKGTASATGDDITQKTAEADFTVVTPEMKLTKTATPKKVVYRAGKTPKPYKFTVTGEITNAKAIDCVIRDIVPTGLEIDETSIETNKDADITVEDNTITAKFDEKVFGKVTLKYKASPTIRGEFVNIASIYSLNHTSKVRAKAKVSAVKTLPKKEAKKDSSKDDSSKKKSSKKKSSKSNDSNERESSQTGDIIMYSVIIMCVALLGVGIAVLTRKK